MLTIGEIFKTERIKRKLSLEEVEKATKIRKKFLDALEKGDYKNLPPSTFVRGFVSNYASFLGLKQEEILAFYRREVNVEKTKVIPEKTVGLGRKFSFTPQFFTAVGIGFLLLLFFVYLLRQYLIFTGAPFLNLLEPQDYAVMKVPAVDVIGKTDSDAILTINGQQVTLDSSGNFEVKIDLSAGLNTFNIVAENKFKRQTSVIRRVRLEQQ